jgi:hypothetical protein
LLELMAHLVSNYLSINHLLVPVGER